MREVISNKLASLSLRDLTLVEAVAQHRGFRSAAEVMGISASGLSHQVRKVEEAIGSTIFERGQKVSLTEQGQITIEIIRKTLLTMAALEHRDHDKSRVLGPQFRIGTISSLAPSDMLRVVQTFEARSPGTQIEVISGKHYGLLRRLMDREIDVLITAEATTPPHCRATEIFSESFTLLSHKSREGRFFLSSEDDFVPPEALAQFQSLPSSGLKRAYGMGIEQRIAFVIAGYGDTIVPHHWIQCQPLTKMLNLRRLDCTRVVRAVWRESYSLGDILHGIWPTRL